MLQVLGKPHSINVRKVLWTCVELGLAPQHEAWGQGCRPTQDPVFLALNPNAMVPVLRDGDFTLWESNAICRYLAARERRDDLLPAEPARRALVEQWMDWQATELNNSWRYAFMGLVRQSPAHADPAAIAHSQREFNRHMAILEGQLQCTGAYAAGDTFTLADVVLGLSVQRWLNLPMDERPALPAAARYFDRLGERPGFLLHCANGMP